MIKIAPSILSADFARLGEHIKQAETGGADLIHVDVMDGHFVPNLTFGPKIVSAVNNLTDIPLDVHLMIENPDNYVQEYVEAGADYVTVHVEACVHLNRSLQLIKDCGAKSGVALNPGTSLKSIDEVWEELDLLLLMTVNPGFGGQKFIPNTLKKIECAAEKIKTENLSIILSVDGGVNKDTVQSVVEAGATELVIGSAIFGQENISAAVKEYKQNV